MLYSTFDYKYADFLYSFSADDKPLRAAKEIPKWWTINEVSSTKCKNCNAPIICGNSLQEINSAQQKRQDKIFLMGCRNFYNIQKNALLLMNGFVSEAMNDYDLYSRIPLDIIKCCIAFCYDLKALAKREKKDTFDGVSFAVSGVLMYGTNGECIKYFPQIVGKQQSICGSFHFGINTIRKVWRVKVIRVTNITIGIKSVKPRMNGGVYAISTMMIDTVLNVGDILCVLCLMKSDGRLELLYGVNDECIVDKVSDIEIGENDEFRLLIDMKYPTQLQLIQ